MINKAVFDEMTNILEKITRDYDERKLKYMQYAEKVEMTFVNYGISKEEYYRELTNQVNGIVPKPIVAPKIKKIPVKKKIEDIPF